MSSHSGVLTVGWEDKCMNDFHTNQSCFLLRLTISLLSRESVGFVQPVFQNHTLYR